MSNKSNSNTDFKEISTPDGLIEYLSSKRRLEKSEQIYHYTRLSSIISIIKSGYWIIKSPSGMNDAFEYQNWSEQDWKNIFFISFMMEQKENIGMWSIYAQPWDNGVKVAIDSKIFRKWIEETKVVYAADPDTFTVDLNIRYVIGEDAEIKHTAVAYSNFEKYSKVNSEIIHVSNRNNDILGNVTGIPSLAGYIKNDAWDYEKEIRLRVKVNPMFECRAVAIKVTDELINAMTIVKGPRFVGNLQEEISKEIQQDMKHDTSLFYDRLQYVPCDKCILK